MLLVDAEFVVWVFKRFDLEADAMVKRVVMKEISY